MISKHQLSGLAFAVAIAAVGMWWAFTPKSNSPPEASPAYEIEGCYEDICAADPMHADAVYLRERYGLEQITSDEPAEVGIQLAEDMAAWQVIRSAPGDVPASDIMAINLTSRRLIPVGVGLDFHQTSPFLANGRIVFAEERNAAHKDGPSRAYLAMWDTGSSVALETGLGGEAIPSAFDGTWVVFRQRASTVAADDGLWAMNVDDGRKVRCYPATRSPRTAEFSPVLTGEAVDQGRAYLSVTWENESTVRNASLLELDLDMGTSRSVASTDALGEGVGRWWVSDAGAGSVTWQWSRGAEWTQLWSWQGSTGRANAVSTRQEGAVGLARIHGDAVVYNSPNRGVLASNISTGKTVLLAPSNDGEIGGGAVDTHGGRFLVSVFKESTRFSSFAYDLYLAAPNPPPASGQYQASISASSVGREVSGVQAMFG